MVGSLLLAAAFQVGPFYEQKPGYVAVRPAVAVEDGVTDMLSEVRVVLTATDKEIADAKLESGMY